MVRSEGVFQQPVKGLGGGHFEALRHGQSPRGACPQIVGDPAQHLAVRRAVPLVRAGREHLSKPRRDPTALERGAGTSGPPGRGCRPAAREAVGPRDLHVSPLWTLQRLCFGPDVAAANADRGENRGPPGKAPGQKKTVDGGAAIVIYAERAKAVEQRRRAFLRKWRLRCPAVATSLEEAGDRLFAFLRLPSSQWKSARTTNAIERLHEEFRRRIKTQTVLPSAETAAMLFWALLASGQITMRRVNGWQTLAQPLGAAIPVDLAA